MHVTTPTSLPRRRVASFALVALGILVTSFTVDTSEAAGHPDDAKRACIAASTQGQTLRSDEKLIEAREQMLICARDTCPAVVRTHCTKWLAEIEEKIPSIVVRPQDASGGDVIDASIVIDGKPAKLDGKPVSLDPGPHVIQIERADGTRKEEHVLLADREKSRLIVVIVIAGRAGNGAATGASAASSGASSSRPGAASSEPSGTGAEPHKGGVPTGAWILGGVGIVALGSFTYFGLSAKSALDTLKTTCSPNCTSSQTSPGRTKALVADISLGAGVLAIGGAVIWAILANSGKSEAAASAPMIDVQPMVGGAYGSVTARY
jgi:hypothetical protein